MQYFLPSVIVVITVIYCDVCNGHDDSTSIYEACESGLDFDTILQLEKFIAAFKLKSEEQLIQENAPKSCITNRHEILELGKVVTTEEVCDPYKIEDMINFHKRYLNHNSFFGPKPITQKIFTKYAIQVAYNCKKNMINNLEIAREELKARSKVFEEARDKVYNDEPSIKSNIKLIEEQPDDPASTNIKPMDDAEMTLSEYREALVKLRRPEDILTFDRNDCVNSKNRNTKITKDKLQLFFKPALVCHQLHRYYAGSILSVAKLANIGYVALDEEIDSELGENPAIRDWIIAAQVCEPMLYFGTKEIQGDWATIDTCSPKISAIEPMVYDDKLVELEPKILSEMIPKSQATRSHAQRLMKSALKKMAKVNIMKQLKSGTKKSSIFSKSLSIFGSQDIGSKFASESEKGVATSSKFAALMPNGLSSLLNSKEDKQLSDQESYELLMGVVDHKQNSGTENEHERDNDIDQAVSFDPMTSLFTTLTVLAIMLSFEWLFFIVMTLAARLCHRLYFNFDNLLTFPPKFLSWSDADFAQFNDKMEKIDEDDYLDYDELTPDEQEQRNRLEKVFGRPPPMLYKD